MKNALYVEAGTNGMAVVFTALQTNQIFQLISLILTCVSITISICISLIKWYKDSKADGKIDIDEIKKGAEIIKDGTEKIKDEIDKNKDIKK